MTQHLTSHRAQPIRSVKSAGQHIAPFLICMSLPLSGWTQTGELLLNASPDRKGTATSPGIGLPLESFRYIPPGGASKNQQVLNAVKRSPEQQRILDFNAAGNYQAAGTEGLALMAVEKLDDELQLIIANSLAWTGRVQEAIPTYQGLGKGKYANEANIGLANVFRWNGRDDQAAPLYRAVLAIDPENADAIEGLELSDRSLRPRTTVSVGNSSDSSDIRRRAVTLNHRWRDSTGSNIMEIETSTVRDRLPAFQANQQDLTFRYQNLTLALKPSFEISSATKTSGGVFASGQISLVDEQLSLQAGRINWGRIATNPNGLAANLSALNAGLMWSQNLTIGKLLARANYYDISDGNRIITSSVSLASSWRPLGSHFKPFLGIETRDAKFSSANYWSPAQGYGTAYAGVLAEWDGLDWGFYASAQAGTALYGEAGKSWNVGIGGKRWIASDIAIGLSASALSSRRDSSVYRAKSANVSLEKLWK
ncbi:MAG: hypothetical protein EAZ34_03000 [Polaromonas sp.]|nr:MAG: hypothetical protein EAZ34_03000 [Polaromonas sp.]